MQEDHPSFDENHSSYFLGGVAEEILGQISQKMEQEMDPAVLESMQEKIKSLEGPQQSAFILGKLFGQLAITENEPRLFYASIACLWFSSAFSTVTEAGTAQELMDLAEFCWKDAQESISKAISESVDQLIEEI
jgi:hypothetical protein